MFKRLDGFESGNKKRDTEITILTRRLSDAEKKETALQRDLSAMSKRVTSLESQANQIEQIQNQSQLPEFSFRLTKLERETKQASIERRITALHTDKIKRAVLENAKNTEAGSQNTNTQGHLGKLPEDFS